MEIENISDNFKDNSDWYSVYYQAELYRVEVENYGYFVYGEDGNFVEDEEVKQALMDGVKKFRSKEQS